MISVATYHSEAEIIAAYKARQSRFAAAARNVANKAKPALVLLPSPERAIEPVETDLPQQDAHCVAFREALPDLRKVSLHKIKRYIVIRSYALGVSCWDVMGPCKSNEVVAARDQIVWEIKTDIKPEISYPELGRLFGHRDHTTMLSSYRRGAAANGDAEAAERVRHQRISHAEHHRRRARGV